MNKINHPVVCFGEVLWDILPSGTQPGGAPMNVAYHLQQLQKDPAIITKIGDDNEGRRLLDLFASKHINTEFIQTDQLYPTGKVYGTQDAKGDMTYEIVQPAAWDFIEWQDAFAGLLGASEYFVYGSLAARNIQSSAALFKLLEAAPQKVLDINLRAPHFKKNILLDLMKKADLLKMNEEELALTAPWFCTYTNAEDQIKAMSEQLGLSLFVVTKGGNGAVLFKGGEMFSHPGIKVKVADTVGSGDAFLAALLAGLLDKKPADVILDTAVRLGSFVATQKGGMPEYDLQQVADIVPDL